VPASHPGFPLQGGPGGFCCLARLCYTAAVLGFLAELPLPGYRALVAAGLGLGAAMAACLGRRRGLPLLILLDGGLAAAAGGLLLGRALYVGANWPYFQEQPWAAWAFWRGGLAAAGVVAGGIAGALLFCCLRRCDPRPLLDTLAPGAALLALAAWLGCLQAGCACGIETWPDQGWRWALSADLPDLYGLRAPRLAVQALGALWSAVTLTAALIASRKRLAFPLWLLLYSVGDGGLAFLRADARPLALGLSALHWADLTLSAAALAALWLWRRPRRDP